MPGFGQLAALVFEHDVAAPGHRVGDGDAEAAGEMVVAHPRVAQRRRLARQRPKARAVVDCHRDDAFEHLRHRRRGQPEIAVPPRRRRGDQAGLGQLGEVGAGRLRRHARGIGELGRGHRAAVEQRDEDVGARRIAREGGDLGNHGSSNHGRSLPPRAARRTADRFGRDRSTRRRAGLAETADARVRLPRSGETVAFRAAARLSFPRLCFHRGSGERR